MNVLYTVYNYRNYTQNYLLNTRVGTTALIYITQQSINQLVPLHWLEEVVGIVMIAAVVRIINGSVNRGSDK